MLATHEHVESHNGHDIYQRLPGFEFTPITLGKIASYIVRGPDDEAVVFAFMYALLHALDGDPVDEEALLADAVEPIRRRIDAGELTDRSDVTFVYRGDTFVEVREPRWWVPFWG